MRIQVCSIKREIRPSRKGQSARNKRQVVRSLAPTGRSSHVRRIMRRMTVELLSIVLAMIRRRMHWSRKLRSIARAFAWSPRWRRTTLAASTHPRLDLPGRPLGEALGQPRRHSRNAGESHGCGLQHQASMPGASVQLCRLLQYERIRVLGNSTMLLSNASRLCKELCIHRSEIRPQLARAWSST